MNPELKRYIDAGALTLVINSKSGTLTATFKQALTPEKQQHISELLQKEIDFSFERRSANIEQIATELTKPSRGTAHVVSRIPYMTFSRRENE